MSTAGYIYYNYSAKQIQIQNENELTWIAVLKINQIVQWNKERTADAKVISSDPLFISGIEEWLINKNNKSLTADITLNFLPFKKDMVMKKLFSLQLMLIIYYHLDQIYLSWIKKLPIK